MKVLALFLLLCMPALAKDKPQYTSALAPSAETLALSLKTISKALVGCRESYTRIQPGKTAPLMKLLIGADAYDKDIRSLSHAETITNFFIAHPDQITGKGLVAILSTTDDFSVGVGSTRAEILRSVMGGDPKVNAQMAEALVSSATSLNDCQHSLFNAGDDYVELVLRYVGAEEDALANRGGK